MTISQNITVRKVVMTEPNRFRVTKIENAKVIKFNGTVIQNIDYGTASIYEEALAGTINGVNTIFTTTFNYVAGTTRIFKNGLKQRFNIDYSESGLNEITFDEAPDATGFTDILTINYIKV